jgi:trimeric autotransporter adhesin
MKPILKILLIIIPFTASFRLSAQVLGKFGANQSTLNANSVLEIESTSKGVLLPRLNTVQQNAMSSPPNGMLIYNTDSACFVLRRAGIWRSLCAANSGDAWSTLGNASIDANTHFLGTTDNQSIRFRTNNAERVVFDSLGRYTFGGKPTGTSYDHLFYIYDSPAATTLSGGTRHQSLVVNQELGLTTTNALSYRALQTTTTTTSASTANFTGTLMGTRTGVVHNGSGTITETNGAYIYNQIANGRVYTNTGLRIDVDHATTGTSDAAYGVAVNMINLGTVKQPVMYGFSSTSQQSASGIRKWYGYHTTVAGLNIDSAYAYYVDNRLGSITGAAKWSFYNASSLPMYSLGYVGINTTSPQYKLDIDAQTVSAGNPLRLLGLNAGASTDSVLTSASGVVRRLAINEVLSNAWNIAGNGNTTDGTHFLGTTNNIPLNFRVFNSKAGRLDATGVAVFGYQAANVNTAANITALGYQAGLVSTGVGNTFIGYQSGVANTTGARNFFSGYQSGNATTMGNDNHFEGYRAGYTNITGTNNTFIGNQAGYLNTGSNSTFVGFGTGYNNAGGSANTFLGYYTGYNNTSGIDNTFIGTQAGFLNATGQTNTFVGAQAGRNNDANNNAFIGYQSGYGNTSGINNTSLGYQSAYTNTTGSNNIVIGTQAGQLGTGGSNSIIVGYQAGKNNAGVGNVLMGYQAGFNHTSGANNVAIGQEAAFTSTVAWGNTAIGHRSLYSTVSGQQNVAIGDSSLYFTTTSSNVALGYAAGQINTVGTNNTYLGYAATASANNWSNSTAIGNGAVVNASNKIRLGNATVTLVETQGSFVTVSDKRLKTNINDNYIGLNFIKAVRPVHYELKAQKGIVYDGFIAQELDSILQKQGIKSFSGVVKPSNTEGGYYTVSYATFVVPLVNAVKELDAESEKLKAKNEKLVADNEQLKEVLEKLKKDNASLRANVDKNSQDIEVIKAALNKKQN